MKSIFKIFVLLLVTNPIFANNLSIKGEWKGAFIINAYVSTATIYINSNASEQIVSIDIPSRKMYEIKYQLSYKNNQIYLSRKNKDGVVIEFKGQLENNIISGTYHYNSKYMKDKPGIFQMMKSNATIIKGDEFPEFNLELINKQIISSNNFKPKYLLIDFWATWCAPCVAKRPKLEEIYSKNNDKLEIVSISLDKNIAIIEKFRNEKFSMKWLHSIKPTGMKDPFVKKYIPGGLPYGYIINPDGKVIAVGNDLSAQNLGETFNRVLK